MTAPSDLRQVHRADRRVRSTRTAQRLDRDALIVRGRALLGSPRRPLVTALLVAAAGVLAFARISEDYVTNDPLARWDVSLARWFAEHRSALGVEVFNVVTHLGSTVVCVVVAAVAAVLLIRRRRLLEAALLPVALVGAEVLDLVLKRAFHRERPHLGAVHLDTYSYPSGHATAATAVYGAAAFLLWRATTRRRAHAAIAVGLVAAVAIVAFSRLYLGVHYLSDVLAGISAGATLAALAIALLLARARTES